LVENEDFDVLNKTLVDKAFDWNMIKSKCKKFVVINSDDDSYVPLDKGKELARKLGVELIVVNKAGHINSESGYDKFELLLEKIKEID